MAGLSSQPPASLQDLHALRDLIEKPKGQAQLSNELILANAVVWLWTTSLQVITPQWKDTYAALLQYLRGLGDSQPTTGVYSPPLWGTLQNFLSYCVELMDDLLGSESIYPLSIPFNDPNISHDGSQPITDHFLLIVKAVEDLPQLLTFFLKLIIDVISPNLQCHWFLSGVMNRLSATAQRLFDFCMSTTYPASNISRAADLTRIITAVSALSRQYIGLEGMIGDLAFTLIRVRLEQGPKQECEAVDAALTAALGKPVPIHTATLSVVPIINILRSETWEESGNTLRDLAMLYLRRCVPYLDSGSLTVLRTLELREPPNSSHHTKRLLEELDVIQPRAESTPSVQAAWRNQVRATLASVVSPDEISWMDDEHSFTNLQYAQRALEDVQHRFQQPLCELSAKSRASLANSILKLVNILTHPDKTHILPLQLVSAHIGVLTQLLTGEASELTPIARFRIFQLFGVVTKHDTKSSPQSLDESTVLLFQGMRNRDRSGRVAAGRALANIVHVDPGRLEPIFSQLYHLLDKENPKIQETTLVTAGLIARTANQDVLGQSVRFFIHQLDQKNPVVQGTAYVQLQSVAKHHKMSPASLLKPYLEHIAPLLLTSVCTRPELLRETCRLMTWRTSDFMATTAILTLPHLFANGCYKELSEMSKRRETTPANLFFMFAPDILAYIYLLPNADQTAQGLSFIQQVLEEAAIGSNTHIPPGTFVKSNIVHLLARLIVLTGHESQETVESAINALNNVSRTLSRPESPDNLGNLLHECILGITTGMVEMLRDKNSVAHKCQILRSIGVLITQVGAPITSVATQLMATFQNRIATPEFAEATLSSWYTFLSALPPKEIAQHVGPTSASIISAWSHLSPEGLRLAATCINYIVFDIGNHLGEHVDDIVDLALIPELSDAYETLRMHRSQYAPNEQLIKILARCSSHNVVVALQSMGELKRFMLQEQAFILEITTGDMFDSLAGRILEVLTSAACRDGDSARALRTIAFECIGVFGAVDPDRCEIRTSEVRTPMLNNFADEEESATFVLRLITDLLVVEFQSTSDIAYQLHLAYSIQGLMLFCNFSSALVTSATKPAKSSRSTSLPMKVRNRWRSLPDHVKETIAPLLCGTFTREPIRPVKINHPIYPHLTTYRQWIQQWAVHLISRSSGKTARQIFDVFRDVARYKDGGIAYHILPHLVLHVLISGTDDDARAISDEFLIVLNDQVSQESTSSQDKRLLSAQAVFMLLDHLNRWARSIRIKTVNPKDSKRARSNRGTTIFEEHLVRVDSVLSSIDLDLMAQAAFQCKSYARSLMNFERQIRALRENTENTPSDRYAVYYERLHEIYARIDEPDGMEGVSTLILSPSLEHQIRHHESIGHWTSAQSCWEVRLQHSPDNLDYHLGLLRCLRNLGHYDTLRTHVRGVLTRNPNWTSELSEFEVESAWMVGAWDDVHRLVDQNHSASRHIVMAKSLLAIRSGDARLTADTFSTSRVVLGSPILAAGPTGYRRAYDAVLDLHVMYELELISHTMLGLSNDSTTHQSRASSQLAKALALRLDATLPNFRSRETVLSMRRTAFALSAPSKIIEKEVGQSWLASAKVARKAGLWQTAYSAVLKAQQHRVQFAFMESAKLLKASGEPLRALNELENSMRLLGILERVTQVVDLTKDDPISDHVKAKTQLLRARWMNESARYESNPMFYIFQHAVHFAGSWESANYYLGQFYDQVYKELSRSDQINRGVKMSAHMIKYFAKAVKYGSKFVYQAIPRMLSIWLDGGEDPQIAANEQFKALNNGMSKAIADTPAYKWFTAFPQIVSRVGLTNTAVYTHLAKLIALVLQEYPAQGLWLFTSVVKSTKDERRSRGVEILEKLKNDPRNAAIDLSTLINRSLSMIDELLALCNFHIEKSKSSLSMVKDFPKLHELGHRSPLIIPLQESLTASLPPTSSGNSTHQPFPDDAPTFDAFEDPIEIMHSMAKPRKITIRGSNGHFYNFLGKPKDDLRKDGRLMEFDSMINKLLKSNSESRRRQLHIRTYGVVTLNEECGFIQWVDNTIPVRTVLIRQYDSKGIPTWSNDLHLMTSRIKAANDKDATAIFKNEILRIYPPVFHNWFSETFPEPATWLASRLTYGRSLAVMSMVGFILGLGDRHGENILLDWKSGDVVHVDFNCLFEKGKTLDTPERVPFRLTSNIVDGLGVTGVEGVFRKACEVTLQILRENKDSLMNVLDAFVHDPLVEWVEERKRMRKTQNHVRATVDEKMLARNAILPIRKKLEGIYGGHMPTIGKEPREREISTSNLVQVLIQEATDPTHLARMYSGWTAWH